MAQKISIEIKQKGANKTATDIKKVGTASKDMGQKVSKSMKGATKTVGDFQVRLNKMGNKLRFMAIAFGALAAGSIGLVKSFIDSAKEMEAATLRVGVFAVSSGESMEKAQEAALNLAMTGLVSVTEASNTLANLLATGLNIDTATVLMNKMLDAAVLSKESLTDTFGRALEKSSLGIRILQERQVDAIGINFRADQVWRAYGKTIGKTTAEMSTQEKQMAIVNFLMKETERFAGGAELAMNTFGGTMSRLNTTVEITKAKIGATLIPLIGTLADAFASLSRSISSMADKHAVWTSIMITGTVVVVSLGAALAIVGAMIPLLKSGFTGIGSIMGTLTGVTALLAIKFILLAAAVGGLIFLVLKVTGAYDGWINRAKNLAKAIKDTIKEFDAQGETASEAASKIAKQVANLEKQMALTTRSYRENLAEWVRKNKKAVKDITNDISDLEQKYEEAVNKINSSFERSMEDSSIAHSRKTEDIKRELDEEVSKGIWADATKIRGLKRRLKRENEDFARHSKDLNDDKDKDLGEEKTRFSEKLTKLKAELDKEIEMQKNHVKDINDVRNVILLDEIDRMKRQRDERLASLQEQLNETQKSTEAQGAAFNGLADDVEKVGEETKKVTKIIEKMSKVTSFRLESLSAVFAGVVTGILTIKIAWLAVALAMKTTMGITIGVWFINMAATISAAIMTGPLVAVGTLGAALASLPVLITIAIAFGAFAVVMEQIARLKGELNDLNDSVGEGARQQTEYLRNIRKATNEGKMSIEEHRQKLKTLMEEQEEVSKQNQQLIDNLSFPGIFTSGLNKIQETLGFQTRRPDPNLPAPITNIKETVIPNITSPIININNPTIREDSDLRKMADSVSEIFSQNQFLRQFK